MKFKDLLKKYDWKDIRPVILTLYPDQKKNINGYKIALEELLVLKSAKTKMRIIIKEEFDVDEQERYYDVSAKDDRETFWAMDFMDWKKCLDMEIDPETLSKHSSLDIIAHCLWEITWHGFTQEEVKKKANELAKAAKIAKKDIEKERKEKK